MIARFRKERVRDSKEYAGFRRFFVHQRRVLPIVDCEIRPEVPDPWNL